MPLLGGPKTCIMCCCCEGPAGALCCGKDRSPEKAIMLAGTCWRFGPYPWGDLGGPRKGALFPNILRGIVPDFSGNVCCSRCADCEPPDVSVADTARGGILFVKGLSMESCLSPGVDWDESCRAVI